MLYCFVPLLFCAPYCFVPGPIVLCQAPFNLADFRNLDSALHRLQTSIQALLDIGAVLVSRLGLPAPRTSIDILSSLEEAGYLPEGSSVRFRPIIGFRNRVVHLYERIDEKIVYKILTEERADLAERLELLLDAHSAAA